MLASQRKAKRRKLWPHPDGNVKLTCPTLPTARRNGTGRGPGRTHLLRPGGSPQNAGLPVNPCPDLPGPGPSLPRRRPAQGRVSSARKTPSRPRRRPAQRRASSARKTLVALPPSRPRRRPAQRRASSARKTLVALPPSRPRRHPARRRASHVREMCPTRERSPTLPMGPPLDPWPRPPPSSGTGEPSISKSAPSTSRSGQPCPGEMAPPRPGPSSKLATRWSPLITIRSSSSGVMTREVGPPFPEPHRTSAVADPPLPPSTGELPVTEAAPPLPGPSMPSTGNSQTMEGVFREGLQALNRTLEKSVGSPHEWDLLRREIRDLTRGLENTLVTPNLELKQEMIKVRMAAEGIRADTRKLQELAGLKGVIESVRDMRLPLFQQHVENQRTANLQMMEQNRQLGTILQIWENERAGRGTAPKSNNHH